MSVRRANRIDGNQAEIVKAVRAAGAQWIPCVPPFGADGLILLRGKPARIIIAEIKDGTAAPSARKLTQGELKLQAICKEMGAEYAVITSVADLFALLKGYVSSKSD